MDRIKFLKEEITAREEKIDKINSLCEKEGRARTSEEKETWKSLEREMEDLREELEDLEEVENRKKSNAAKKFASFAASGSSDSEEKELSKIGQSFMFTKAMQAAKAGKALDGVEREMYEEAEREVKENGKSLEGNIAIPSKFIQIGKKQKRDLTIATEGGDVRPLDLQSVIPILAPNPVISQLGAQTLTGIVGNVQFPRHNGAASLAWEGETDANAETTPTFDKVEMSPNRVGGFIDVSQTFIRQTSFDAESWVRNELNRVIGLEIDETSFQGSGSGSEPTGILNVAGIGSADIGTNGGAPTYSKVKELLSDVEVANALMGDLSFVSTPQVAYKLAETPKQASGVEGNFVYNMERGENLLGYNYVRTNQMPSNLTKGTGTNLHALLFGNFSEWIIGQWGGIDLLVDPYTQATSGLIRVVINAYFDMDTRHAASFSAIQDIDVS